MCPLIGRGAYFISLLIILSLSFLACTKDPVVATVGDFKIYRSDVERKNTITRIYFPGEERDLGLELLIKSLTLAQVLKNNHHEINESTLQKEMERIEKNTLRPEMLSKIKGVFGGDSEAYKRVYILPTYAERTIYYDFFLRDPNVQANSVHHAQEFLEKVKRSPATFLRDVKSLGGTPGRFQVSLSQGFRWEIPKSPVSDLPNPAKERQITSSGAVELDKKLKMQDDLRASEEGRGWVDRIAKPLKVGEVHPQVIDLNEQWLVARLEKIKKTPLGVVYYFDGVTFPKEDYNAWLSRERAKVKVIR